jgi:hypothetical protein
VEDGELEGSEDRGSKDGRFVGLIEGLNVGDAVVSMVSVTFEVGRSEIEGVEVGSGTVGENEGRRDGRGDGNKVGFNVGCCVGELVRL